jgi:hypothetical protein
MSSVVISGDTSGSITLQAPAVAGTTTLTLPTTSATLATLTTPSFGTTIGVGGATASASGAGVSFPATQSASSDANTLDDYEKGTWTPVVTSGSGSITTVGAVSGVYTKVGNIVVIECTITITTNGTGASSITVNGLPFTSSANAYIGAGRENAFSGKMLQVYVLASSTTLAIKNYDDTYPAASGSTMFATATYRTS